MQLRALLQTERPDLSAPELPGVQGENTKYNVMLEKSGVALKVAEWFRNKKLKVKSRLSEYKKKKIELWGKQERSKSKVAESVDRSRAAAAEEFSSITLMSSGE